LKLYNTGEYWLIDHIRRYLKKFLNKRLISPYNRFNVVVGPGDDSAVIDILNNCSVVISTDTLVENTHFKLNWAGLFGIEKYFYFLGYKSIAINISDLSAMGAVKPLFCLVSLGLTPDCSIENIDRLYDGIQSLTKKYGMNIIGGDIFKSENIIISVTIIGVAKQKSVVTRAGAKIGDKIYVTGNLGDSRAGLEILQRKNDKTKLNSDEKYLVLKHLCPPIRIKEAEMISEYATSMMDCSDGLYLSLKTIGNESNVGMKVNVDKIPVSKQLINWTKNEMINYSVIGGEDYELVFTSGYDNLDKKLNKIKVWQIGEIVSDTGGIVFYSDKRRIRIDTKNIFEHFSV